MLVVIDLRSLVVPVCMLVVCFSAYGVSSIYKASVRAIADNPTAYAEISKESLLSMAVIESMAAIGIGMAFAFNKMLSA